jgi:hypothetical protein
MWVTMLGGRLLRAEKRTNARESATVNISVVENDNQRQWQFVEWSSADPNPTLGTSATDCTIVHKSRLF